MNLLGSASMAFMPVIVWKTVEAPRFLKGYTFTASSGFCLCVWTFVVLFFYKRQERKYARQNGIVLYNSLTDPEPIRDEHTNSSETDEKKSTETKVN